jgi:integrase
MKKRGHGEGSLIQDKRDGRWHGSLMLPNGKRRHVYDKTRRGAQQKLSALRREVDAGLHGTLSADRRLCDYARDYLDARPQLRSNTRANYEWLLSHHLDGIGQLPLSRLTAQVLQAHYTAKLQTHSASTVAHLHAFLHVVLNHACSLDIIPKNPADFVDAPSPQARRYEYLTDAQVPLFLAGCADERFGPLYTLALATGMREGELLGLRWEDVDLVRSQVRVNVTLHRVDGVFVLEPPKSRASIRTLPLPAVAVAALVRWREVQEADKARVGGAWLDRFGLVFTSVAGLPLHSSNVIHQFHQLMVRLRFSPRLRIHDLRHTFATLLIERGVPIKVVSELLGHSSIAITLQIYGHVTPKMRDRAVVELDDLLKLGE